jgi:hypothetical protein
LPQISHPNVESNSDENNGADSNLVNAGADRIQEALRVTIRMMKEEADNMSNGRVKRSMTWTRVRFLQQNTVDDLVNLYMPGFSHKVKVLFTKSHLSLEDLCELPSAALDKKTGIYLLNAVRNAVALGGYVGSSSGQDGIHKRDKDHTSAAKPGSKEKGIVYDLLRQTGVDKMNRVLASFASPLPDRQHLFVLEAILTVWFATLVEPQTDKMFSTIQSWRMCERIQSEIDIPSVP